MFVHIKRIIRSGFFNFFRNGFVSFSSVLVMLVTLFVIGSVIFSSAILNSTLEALKDKVDIRVTFVTTAEEQEILNLKDKLEALSEVENVSYTSREEALVNFKQRHGDDQLILQALEELGDNPLGSSLNIKAKDPSQYESVANFLQNKEPVSNSGASIIDKINFFQNKTAIDKLSNIINSSEKLGFIITAVLVIMSVLITFNTIRLAIYISRDEISVMKLVGADSSYIRGPFVVSGVLYGFFASVLTLLIFFPTTLWLADMSNRFFISFNAFDYYMQNFLEISAMIVLSGIVIGAISSYLASRRYLK
ncbi:MAG: permease-like cell division protein FtsX [Patescibacteria group bacterium]